ncbi:VOC family protein [Streptomyces sp. NBC_01012]|uniref:VOC family protein n=1 Tax=Streptomyces sp. NBC_01012 TaxID=2903717 RepID=UPI003862EE6C|nr:VOC family protein [Streptomyces sp. NBC_01012]
MSILKTYARLWTDDLDQALPLLVELTGAQPELRLAFESVELAAVGDFLVIAGPADERAKYAHASATVVVEDLDALAATLKAAGATITTPMASGPTGRFLYARHADGSEVEYVEWVPELVRRTAGSGPRPVAY